MVIIKARHKNILSYYVHLGSNKMESVYCAMLQFEEAFGKNFTLLGIVNSHSLPIKQKICEHS